VRSGRRGPRVLGALGWRLFAAFTVVAVGAVGLLALLATLSVRAQTSDLVTTQQGQVRRELVAGLADAYTATGSWRNVDLAGVQALASSAGATLVVLDATGGPVTTVTPHHGTSPEQHGSHDGGTMHHGAVTTTGAGAEPAASTPGTAGAGLPVVVDGRNVGSVRIAFPPTSESAAWEARGALLDTVAIGAALALVLAGVAALVVSRRLTRPLRALASAAGAVERGEPDAGGHLPRAPGELGQVSSAFARMADTLRREEQLRRALVADVAHELRTPVTILRGGTEEILDGLAAPTPERLGSLHDEILRLERLVEDLATLSAAEAAGLTLRRGPVDLAEVASRAVDLLRPRFTEYQVEVRLETRPVVVDADESRLAQVATNLLTNACAFTPPGGRVVVATRPEDTSGVLAVSDSGPGIPADELGHVFERFWRGRAASGHSGTGIGLAVVAEIVAAHGGEVAADSPPGEGARFTVHLPRA